MTFVDIRPLKTKAPSFSEPVKTLILTEPDMMDSQDFISKLGTWEKLLSMEVKH